MSRSIVMVPTNMIFAFQFDEYNRSRTESIGSITFMNNRGQLIELKQFADVFMSSGPTKLERRDPHEHGECVCSNIRQTNRYDYARF